VTKALAYLPGPSVTEKYDYMALAIGGFNGLLVTADLPSPSTKIFPKKV